MRTRRQFLIVPVIAGLATGQPARVRDKSLSDEQLQQLERRLFELINAERKKKGLLPLVWSDLLAKEARRHSFAMLEGGFFSHDDPKRGGLEKRLNENPAKIPWRAVAENVFTQQGRRDPVNNAVDSWMRSRGHRENALNKTYTDTGVGMVCSEGDVWFVTQIFAWIPQAPQAQ